MMAICMGIEQARKKLLKYFRNTIFRGVVGRRLLRLIRWGLCFVDRKPSHVVKKVLIDAGESLGGGDLIMVNSVVNVLRIKYPDADLIVLRQSIKTEHFFKNHSWVNGFEKLPESLFGCILFIWRMRRYRFDMYASHQKRTLGLSMLFCDIPIRIGHFYERMDKWCLTDFIPLCSQHWSEWAIAYAKLLGMEELARSDVPAIRYEPEPPIHLDAPRPIVAMHVGGRRGPLREYSFLAKGTGARPKSGGMRRRWNRRWRLDRYAEICRRICETFGASVFLLGDEMESAENTWLCQKVLGSLPDAQIYDLCGTTTNNQSLIYIHNADLFIGNDSGPMHAAVALGTPTITLFGPTSPKAFGADEIDDKHVVIHKKRNLGKCESCHFNKGFVCEYATAEGDPKCLVDIEVEDVWPVVEGRLNKLQYSHKGISE